ncbi:MAG: hypothetical protein KTR26_05770 [Flammeovirgaceae bacterium]|nr:hypothetical protein [Flammeovirgaceae bacterium]
MSMLNGEQIKENQINITSTPKNKPKPSPEPNLISKSMITQPRKNSLKLNDEDFENWLNDYGYIFEERMQFVKEQFEINQVDLGKYPEVKILIENPIQAFKDMRKGKYMNTLWQSFEQKYLDQLRD